MATTPWQQRIRRAERLAAQYAFAAEILGFYIHTARFQEGVYQRMERSSMKGSPISLLQPNWSELLATFPAFLAVVEDKAPASLAQVARDLGNSNLGNVSSDSWTELLTRCWSNTGTPTEPEEFLALLFLQPCAEFLRSHAGLQSEGYTLSLCPFCNRKPTLGVLRPLGDGGRRSLLCGFCLAEWEFRRLVCAGCGQEDHSKLPVYTAEEFSYIRVECCDSCHNYIKTIDLTKSGLAEPLVDELASIPLNLWAQEHGYAKLHPNLMGM